MTRGRGRRGRRAMRGGGGLFASSELDLAFDLGRAAIGRAGSGLGSGFGGRDGDSGGGGGGRGGDRAGELDGRGRGRNGFAARGRRGGARSRGTDGGAR